jgi:hypothetical protein
MQEFEPRLKSKLHRRGDRRCRHRRKNKLNAKSLGFLPGNPASSSRGSVPAAFKNGKPLFSAAAHWYELVQESGYAGQFFTLCSCGAGAFRIQQWLMNLSNFIIAEELLLLR